MSEYVMGFFREFWDVLGEMAPYLLFGFLVAGVLSVLISPAFVERHLGGRGLLPSLKAAVFGIPLPLCSCGVIPVAASLRFHGASKGSTTAFLISTPQTGVDSIFVTYSLLGFVFAVFRPIAALVNGLLGGWLVDSFDDEEPRPDGAPAPSGVACRAECCNPASGGGKLGRMMRYAFITLPRDIGKPLLIGLAITGVIGVAVPEDFFARYFDDSFAQMGLMALVGLPLYVCATASVPIAAALVMKGISPGAAFVFLMTGPATNAAALATVWKVLGRRATFLYLAAVAVTAFASGFVLDLLFREAGSVSDFISPAMLPAWVRNAGGVALLAVLAAALFKPHSHEHGDSCGHDHHEHGEEDMTAVTLDIRGMTCEHCAESVRRVLSEQEGVAKVRVNLEKGEAEILGRSLDPAALAAAVERLGYTAVRRS